MAMLAQRSLARVAPARAARKAVVVRASASRPTW
jgi:hypothetical protein